MYHNRYNNCRISYLCIYDLYGPVHNAFDAGSIHYEGKWEGVRTCEMASSRQTSAIWGPIKVVIFRAQLPPTCPSTVMDASRIKIIMHGAI